MKYQELESIHLKLRAFSLLDAPLLTQHLQDPEISDTTMTIPFPYHEEHAVSWISNHEKSKQECEAFHWAMVEKSSSQLVGAISLTLNLAHSHGEVGYWIAKQHWNKGYMTEALASLIHFSFEGLGLHKVYAHHISRNPASGRVMQKAGMKKEGTLREHYRKKNKFEDVEYYGVLLKDYTASSSL